MKPQPPTLLLTLILLLTLTHKKASSNPQIPPFKPLVTGENSCIVAASHLPIKTLKNLLPPPLSPSAPKTLAHLFPNQNTPESSYPFMLSFCQGTNIKDIYTKIPLKTQQELMFIFPANYQGKTIAYLPFLYLDSIPGVLGGFYYGMRKEYHKNLIREKSPHTLSWFLSGIIEASFSLGKLLPSKPSENFFQRIFRLPFASYSYRNNFVFYDAFVYPTKKRAILDSYYTWQDKDLDLSGEDLKALYVAYTFALSHPRRSLGSKKPIKILNK